MVLKLSLGYALVVICKEHLLIQHISYLYSNFNDQYFFLDNAEIGLQEYRDLFVDSFIPNWSILF